MEDRNETLPSDVRRLLAAAQQRIREVEPAVVAPHLACFLVVDVREPQEVLQGFLPGAIHIPRGVLEFRVGQDARFSNRGRRILIYSSAGGRSSLAVKTLQDLGYSNVQSLAGGMQRWAQENWPID